MSNQETVRCGMVQLYVEGGQRDANLERAETLLAEAAGCGCDVAVLPECCDLGWTHPSARDLAGRIPGGKAYDRLAEAARRHRLHVVAGLVERSGERRYNAAVLIGPDGSLLAHSRKINVLDIAQPLYAIGDRLAVGHSEFGAVGLDICADNFPNALAIADTLCRMGADMILSPCSWADDADGVEHYHYGVQFWIDSYAQLARHYGVSVVAVSNVGSLDVGPWAGRQVVGSSVAVGPEGNVLALCQTGWDESAQELRVVDLPIEPRPPLGTALQGLLS